MDRRILGFLLAASALIGACSDDDGGDEASPSTSVVAADSSAAPSAAASQLDPCRLLSDDDAAELLGGPAGPPSAGDGLDQLSSGLDLEAGGFAECTWQATEPGTGGDPDRNFTLALNVAKGQQAVALFEAAATSIDYAEYNLAPVGDMVLVGGDTTFFGAVVRSGDVVIQCDVTNFRSEALERSTDEICVDALGRAVDTL